ncbi:MAG: hypothetical protein AAGA55_08550 [Planctomycetota bacterium]
MIDRIRTSGPTIAAACLSTAALSGCASGPAAADRLADFEPRSTEAWIWTEPERNRIDADRQFADPYASAMDGSVLVFSGTPAQQGSTAYRRDDLLGVRTDDALPNRLGWPSAYSPDLRRQRTYRSSTSAERWVFPTTRRDGYRRSRTYEHRSGY